MTDGGKILVLEDDPGIRRLECSVLERAGYQTEATASLDEAERRILSGEFQLLLLDYRLEDEANGLEFYRRLQARGCDVPAILVTGFGDEARIIEAMRAGMRDFIAKTPNFIELVPATVERVLAQVRQERQLNEAESASRAKDHFLAALSHELRTPMTPVLALVASLRNDDRLPADVREDLETIHRNIDLEARLIDDLLDLTRISRGKLELRLEDTDLKPIVEHAIKTARGMAPAERNLHWKIEIPEVPLPVRVDTARITQVLWNLLKNAIKFTTAGGTISVLARIDSGSNLIWLEVRDNGIGIEPDFLPQIFGAFQQASRTITKRFGGLGLGLAICKAIVDLHGGSITAASEGPGKGAMFTVCLPLHQQPAISGPAPADARGAGESQGGPPLRILLVEDHPDTASIMTRMLRKAGFDVRCAGTMQEALEKARPAGVAPSGGPGGAAVDIVVSDLGLPDGSGMDLMKNLRAEYALPGIALSGYGMDDDVRRSHESGFCRHLTKPVDAQQLVASIREVLQRA